METPERLRTAAIPVQDLTEAPGHDRGQGETAPSVLAPGIREVTGAVRAEAAGERGEGAMEEARRITREQRGSVVEPGEAMGAETRLEEVRTDRAEAGHHAGTKSTTTASRTLHRRHRQERSSRHQELCQETTTAITGLATTTTTVMIPVGSVQVKHERILFSIMYVLYSGDELEACIAVCPGFSARLVLSQSI